MNETIHHTRPGISSHCICTLLPALYYTFIPSLETSSLAFSLFPFPHLEELPLVTSLNVAVLEDRLNALMVIARDVARNRAIKSIEAATLDLRHDPKKADAKSASAESP
jgi:hypothetical protein